MPKQRESKPLPRLIFSHGMTADELIDWNVYIGQITEQQAEAYRNG